MSEAIVNVNETATPVVNVETLTTAEKSAPAPETTAEQLAATLAATQALADAQTALDNCVLSFRRSERDLLSGRIESGKYASQYVALRLQAKNCTRDTAITAIQGRLAEYASSAADCNANVLIQTYHAYQLLCIRDDSGAEQRGELPYGYYVHALNRLVCRNAEDVFVLLPGMETDCLSLFRELVTTKGNDRKTLSDKVDKIITSYALRQAELREKAEKEAQEKAKAARKAAAEAEASAEKAPESEEAKKAALQAKADQRAADAEAARAKRARKAADARVEKLDQKSTGTENEEKRQPEHNPLAAAKAATARDLAASLLAQLAANKAPDDVFQYFISSFPLHKKHAKILVAALAANESKKKPEFMEQLERELFPEVEAPAAPEAPAAKVA